MRGHDRGRARGRGAPPASPPCPSSVLALVGPFTIETGTVRPKKAKTPGKPRSAARPKSNPIAEEIVRQVTDEMARQIAESTRQYLAIAEDQRAQTRATIEAVLNISAKYDRKQEEKSPDSTAWTMPS